MDAVILPVQLSAKMLSSGADASGADAAPDGIPGQEGMPVFFAALLAQQLGIAVDGQPGRGGEAIDADADSEIDAAVDTAVDTAVDAALSSGADLASLDALVQFQQGIAGLPVPPVVNAAAASTGSEPEEALAGLAAPGPAVDVVRGSMGGVDVVEEPAPGRQTIAADSAAFAEAGVRAGFSASSEALAEQVMRPPVASAAQPAAAGASPVVAGAISQPVSSPSWGDVLGDRVMWMVGQQQQGAELRLNPPALGPLEIKLSMNDGQATLTFSTQHMPVKEALEAATPRLREMFGESGINLGSVSVNLGSASQQQGEPQQASRHSQEWGQAQPESNFTSMLPMAVTALGRNGMVDFFA